MPIPKELEEKYTETAAKILDFCEENFDDDEYEDLCLNLLEKLCRKRPSPLLGGKAATWAAGIVYAIGQANFIFDKTQEIYMTATELASGFGISASTAGNKANEIRKMFRIDYFNPEWLLSKNRESNPMTWMVQVNGFIVDVRYMSLEIQQEAFAKRLIPYIPGEKDFSEIESEHNNDPAPEIPKPRPPKPEDPGQKLLFED